MHETLSELSVETPRQPPISQLFSLLARAFLTFSKLLYRHQWTKLRYTKSTQCLTISLSSRKALKSYLCFMYYVKCHNMIVRQLCFSPLLVAHFSESSQVSFDDDDGCFHLREQHVYSCKARWLAQLSSEFQCKEKSQQTGNLFETM